MISEIFQYFRMIVSFLGDISLFLIAVITFYKTTYSKKMKLTALCSHSDKDDGTIRIFKIISRSLLGMIITNVEWIIDDTWKITLLKENVDSPIDLPAMGICEVKTVPYSAIKQADLLQEAFYSKKWYLLITLSDGTIKKLKWKYKNFLSRCYYKQIRNKLSEFKSPSIITCYHHPSGQLLTPYVKYMVNMKTESDSFWFKIYSSGVMGKTIGGYNGLPQIIMNDKSLIQETLQELAPNSKCEIEVVDRTVFSDYVSDSEKD